MQWKRWQWLLLATLAFWASPYILGGFYAGLAVPVYNQVCEGQPVAFLTRPLSQENYTLFLFNQGCNPIEAREQLERIQKDPKAFEKYLGMHRFFNDDVLGNLLANLTALFVQHFVDGVLFGAALLIPLINENVLLKGMCCLVYAGITLFLGYLLSNVAHDVYTSLKRGLSN